MAFDKETNILRELALLDDRSIYAVAVAASAYRAGVADGYQRGINERAAMDHSAEEVKK